MSVMTQQQQVAEWKKGSGSNVAFQFPFANWERKRFLDYENGLELEDLNATSGAVEGAVSNLNIAEGAMAVGTVPDVSAKNAILMLSGRVEANTALFALNVGGASTAPAGMTLAVTANNGARLASDNAAVISAGIGEGVAANDIISIIAVFDFANKTLSSFFGYKGSVVTKQYEVSAAGHYATTPGTTPNLLTVNTFAQSWHFAGLIQPATMPSDAELEEYLTATHNSIFSGEKRFDPRLASL